MIQPASPLKVPDMPTGPASARCIDRPPENLDAPPAPPAAATWAIRRCNDDEAERIRMAKMQHARRSGEGQDHRAGGCPAQQRLDARVARARYTGTPQTAMKCWPAGRRAQQIDAQRSDDPTAAYQARLAQIRGMGVGGSGAGRRQGAGGAPQLLQTSASGGGKNYGAVRQAGQGDRWKLDSQPEAPRSPFELRAGFVVPATLISGINSDLPGQIMAQVAQNVYDTPTGKHLLIPQGSRLVGTYSSDVAYGQARVLVAWQRIVFPDGKAMDIGAMPGATARAMRASTTR
jgi:type IV secretory pathway VirB10-like protein